MAEVLAQLVVDIDGRIGRLNTAMKKAETRSRQAVNKITGMFKGMGVQIGAVFGGVALFAGLKKGLDAFIALDKGMRRVNTVTRISEAELKSLKKQVTALSTELGTPTSEMTGAMYDAVSAGIAVTDVMEFMEIATRTAIGGFTGVAIAGDALTTVMNSWSLSMNDANDVADILFKTVELGKTTIAELGTSLAMVAPLAAASGISFESLAIQLASLTAQGTPTAQAITQLKALIVSFKKNLGEAVFEQNTFAEALQLGIKGYKDSGKTLTEYLGTQEAELAVLGLTGDKIDIVRQKTDQMGLRFKAAGNAFDEAQKSIDKKIQSIITSLTNALFPVLEETIDLIEKAFPKDKKVEFDVVLPLPFGDLFFDKDNIPALKLFKRELEDIKKQLELISPHKHLMSQIISPHNVQEAEETVKAFEKLGRTVKDINDEIAANQKLIDEGNINVSRKLELDAKILELNKELTGEVDKQITGMSALIDLSIQYLDKAKEAGLTGLGEGVQPSSQIIGPQEQETANIMEGAFKAMEASASNIDQKFISILNAGATLVNILNVGVHTFGGALLFYLDKANSLANSIFGIISAFTGGGGGGILGFIFGGGAGQALSPSSVPSIQSGVQANLTPPHTAGGTESALKKLGTGINNLIENMTANEGGGVVTVPVSIDGKQIFEVVQEHSNRATRSGINLDEF